MNTKPLTSKNVLHWISWTSKLWSKHTKEFFVNIKYQSQMTNHLIFLTARMTSYWYRYLALYITAKRLNYFSNISNIFETLFKNTSKKKNTFFWNIRVNRTFQSLAFKWIWRSSEFSILVFLQNDNFCLIFLFENYQK